MTDGATEHVVIIAGSRSFVGPAAQKRLYEYMDWFNRVYFPIAVVCGMAAGADMLGREWAISRGIHVLEFPADWDRYGKAAGYRRNEEMARWATDCVCFWDAKSVGTRHMIDIAVKERLTLQIVYEDQVTHVPTA